ncbi:MAG: hypothetical protein MUC87_22235 [Bacteroidia bacterium]|jgi:hypothetical protein|nr:hypothetical protein [Bacteroidia bacterium]
MTLSSGKNFRNFVAGFAVFASVLLGSTALRGQQFNYTLQQDSVSWQPLSSQTLLNTVNTEWESVYQIPIGFPFSFLGQGFDSIHISTNGSIFFDPQKRYAISSYLGFCNFEDSLGNWSVLGYELSGDTGQRKLTIQFLNVSLVSMPYYSMNYQVVISETGTVSIITGTVSSLLQSHPAQQYSIGIINTQMDTPISGLFVSGSGNSYSLQKITPEESSIPVFTTIPFQGCRIQFIPNP